MTVRPPPADAQGYLENLMHAGQDAMKMLSRRPQASARRRRHEGVALVGAPAFSLGVIADGKGQ